MNEKEIKKIKERINAVFLAEYNSHTSFKDRISLTYDRYVIDAFKAILSKEESVETTVKAFEDFLKDNWYFFGGSTVGYTARPNNDVTLLLYSIAKQVAKYRGVSTISILMPDIVCTSISDNYPDLDKVNLKTVLNSHILSDDGRSLLPIFLLINNEEFNPYFDYQTQADASACISDAEKFRLINHSLLTGKMDEHRIFLEDKETLRGQLNALIEAFKHNSVHGVGTENVAGEGAYSALMRFINFWCTLWNIPEDFINNFNYKKTELFRKHPAVLRPLITEIKFIINLVSNKVNRHSINNCLAVRSTELEELIAGKEEILASIYLGEENKNRAKKMLMSLKGKEQLEKDLKKGNYSGLASLIVRFTETFSRKFLKKGNPYSGQDNLGISTRILERLDIKFDPKNLQDVIDSFKGISVEEIHKLCSLEDASKKIVNAISNVENLGILITEIHGKVAGVLLQPIRDEITSIVKSSQDFSNLLKPLTIQQCMVVCHSLKGTIASIIKTVDDFCCVLKPLNHEQRTVVFEATKECLSKIINNVDDFCCVLGPLNHEQRTVMFEAVKEYLPIIIKTDSDFHRVSNYLNPEQLTVAFAAIKKYLSGMIKTSNDFPRVLKNLSPEQRAVVCEDLKERLPEVIKTRKDFYNVLEHLIQEQCSVLFEAVKERLAEMIKTAYDFSYVLLGLSQEQCIVLCEAVKERLTEIIKTIDDLHDVLKYLTREKQIAVLEAVKEYLPAIIKTDSAFYHALKNLSPKQGNVVREALHMSPLRSQGMFRHNESSSVSNQNDESSLKATPFLRLN